MSEDVEYIRLAAYNAREVKYLDIAQPAGTFRTMLDIMASALGWDEDLEEEDA